MSPAQVFFIRLFLLISSYCQTSSASFWSSCAFVPDALDRLSVNLRTRLIGQDLAHDHLLTHVSAHVADADPPKPLVFSFHGYTGIGKTYTTRLLEESLFTDRGRSKHVHRFAGGHFQDASALHNYTRFFDIKLREAAIMCPNAMFVFDEVHLMTKGLLDHLIPYMNAGAEIDKVSFRKATFILISNLGSSELNRLYLQHQPTGKLPSYEATTSALRDNLIRMVKAQQQSSNIATQGLSLQSLLQQHLLIFIPFFPLHREHVHQCVNLQLQEYMMKAQHQRQIASFGLHTDVASWITNSLPFDKTRVSISGCKQVRDVLVAKVFGVITQLNRRNPASKTKIPFTDITFSLFDGDFKWKNHHVSLLPPEGWNSPPQASSTASSSESHTSSPSTDEAPRHSSDVVKVIVTPIPSPSQSARTKQGSNTQTEL